MAYKVTKISVNLKVGDEIPLVMDPASGRMVEMSDYDIGRWLESKFSKFGLNKSAGVDLPSLGIEIKHYSEKTKEHTIGYIQREHLIKTPYAASHIRSKLQTQYRIKVNKGLGIVTFLKLCDFSDPYIQNKLEIGYEHGRSMIADMVANDLKSDHIRLDPHPDGIGYFEQREKNRLQFRISLDDMYFMENYHNSHAISDLLLAFQ